MIRPDFNNKRMKDNLNQCLSNIYDDKFKQKTLNDFKKIDKDGFVIEDDKLIAYFGLEKKLVIPNSVKEIAPDAIAWDCCHAQKVETVIVPGTVKKIGHHSFAFVNAKTFVFLEGVESFDENAFLDCYMHDVYFPSTVKNIPISLIGAEEGFSDLTFHFTKGSKLIDEINNDSRYKGVKIVEDYNEKSFK